jgi:hypothetical protein
MNALSGAERNYFPMWWAGKNERSRGWVGGGGISQKIGTVKKKKNFATHWS